MFVEWKNEYSENEHTTQTIYRCNAIYIAMQATKGISHRTRTNNFTICMEHKNLE